MPLTQCNCNDRIFKLELTAVIVLILVAMLELFSNVDMSTNRLIGNFIANEFGKDTHTNTNSTHFSNLPILVTGGAGFIGSHTIIELIDSGFTKIIIIDNFMNSCQESINRIKLITKDKHPYIVNYVIDIADKRSSNIKKLEKIISKHKPFACIHFAGLKAVGESVQKPLLYYENNVISTMNLLDILSKYNCNNIIFSSSACVYGNNPNNKMPLTEASQVGVGITNPYGKTKYFIEQLLKDYAFKNKNFKVILLRYFNPIGAHKSGLIGDDPNGIPNNIMPYLTRVAIATHKNITNKYNMLNIFGNDYNTMDGTCIRDYIHVTDLARGHVNALLYDTIYHRSSNVSMYNLGTGNGTSVLQLIDSMEKACGFKIPHIITDRRAGDIDTLYADPALAKQKINWTAKLTVDDACRDSWNWQLKNPDGYKTKTTAHK